MSLRRDNRHEVAHPNVAGVEEENIVDLQFLQGVFKFRPAFVCGQVFGEIDVSHCLYIDRMIGCIRISNSCGDVEVAKI